LQKIADRDYDLIITDMHLPGMDGLYLYQRLKVLRPELAQRVIFISGRLSATRSARSRSGWAVPHQKTVQCR
jgi:CheY-like chemotaxis protein